MADSLKQVREDLEALRKGCANEDLDDLLTSMGEQVDNITQTMASHGARLALVEQVPDNLETKALEARIERLEAAWSRMGERLQHLEQRMEKSAAWASKVNAALRHMEAA